MKLIIKEYLASLKEREELDSILPNLLSQMGLNVISRPGIGTRQNGVDVAAIGKLNDEEEKVYLFSIKAGNLTRSTWNNGVNALRQSLDEIRDVYIPKILPDEYRNKKIIVCLCFGGEVNESVRIDVTSYIDKETTDEIKFEEWNGDKLATLILNNFLEERLLPKNSQHLLRKALAMLDEPESSFDYFSRLIANLFDKRQTQNKFHLKTIRQMHLCLWILFAWSRGIENLEAIYLSAERTLLYAWELSKEYFSKKGRVAESIKLSFSSILYAYQVICDHFI